MKRLSGYPEAVASGVITQQPGEYSAEKLIVPEGKLDLALAVRSFLFPNVMVKAISDSEIPMRRRLLKQFALGILYGLSLVCVGKAASLPGRQPLFPSDCIAILLVGLPGDLESETTFSQQLQGWLDVIANNGKVQKLFVLCDSPESISLPARIDGNVFKANRTNFLALTKRFDLRTNSLTLIAWGHGGKQAATPVLHVQGPRLTPGDFRVVAGENKGLASRWILMFRGSGRFAGELAGENRDILASEHEMMFDSDPIGMTVLLRLMRVGAEISFLRLSEMLGRNTAAWYEERNVARTEEPTLWESGAVTDLGTLGGDWGDGYAINNKGQIAGSSSTAAGDMHAFQGEDGVLIDLGVLDGDSFSSAVGINNSGQVVGIGQTAPGQDHGFVWENGVITDLGTLGGTSSKAFAINERGQVVGESRTANGGLRAVLWTR